jgi:hypothetical protein
MLIRLSVLEGGRPVQVLVAPSAYLDHWALLDAAADADLCERFAKALEAVNGTLVLSWANVAEFIKARSDDDAKRAEAFIERNLPRLFFLNPDPFVDRVRTGGAPGDEGMLRVFSGLQASAGREFTATGLLTVVRGQLLETHDRMIAIFVERLQALRAEYQGGTEMAQRADAPPADRGTRFVLKELVRDYMGVLKRAVEPNDTLDFYHTIVPAVFCDWVLIDSPRVAQMERVAKRLKDAGRDDVRLATLISNKRASGGVMRLVAELEAARS